jgi:nitroreductase
MGQEEDSMDIVEVINKRQSIRAFKHDPIPEDIIRQILENALRAPSWCNTQPWEFAVVTGSQLKDIKQGFLKESDKEEAQDITRPQEYPEPYDSRCREVARKELEVVGIKREDKEGRGWWRLNNLTNYEASCVIYILIDRAFYFQGKGVNAWSVFDCGLVAENIMLLATNYGLGTVAQAGAVGYPGVLRNILGIPDSKLILVGIAIGYPDRDKAITTIRSDRAALKDISKWYGF